MLSLFPFLKVCKTFIRREQLVNTEYADFRTQKLYLYIYRKKKKKKALISDKRGEKEEKRKTHSYWNTTQPSVIANNYIPAMFCCIEGKML